MGYNKFRIQVFKKLTKDEWTSLTSIWDSTGEVLADANIASVNIGLGKKKDKFTVRINNPDNELMVQSYNGNGITTVFNLKHFPIPTTLQTDEEKFTVFVDDIKRTDWTVDNGAGTITFNTAPSSGTNNIEIRFAAVDHGDSIRIWKWKDAEFTDLTSAQQQDALLIDGVIANVDSSRGDRGYTLSITGNNWIEQLLDTLVPIASVDKKCFEIINDPNVPVGLLATVANYNPSRTITWDPANPSAKSNGDDFDVLEYKTDYKTALEIIEELSTDEYTGDGQYIWNVWVATYTDNFSNPSGMTAQNYTAGTRYLTWRPKTTTTTSNIIEGTDAIENVKINKKVDGVINAIIYYLGRDAYGHSHHNINFDPVSMGKNGAKWKYITKTKDLLRGILAYEKENGGASFWPEGKNTGTNFPASYNYTFQFPQSAGIGTKIALSDKDFNDKLKEIADEVGQRVTQQILDRLKNPRYEAKLVLKNTTPGLYNVGKVYNCTLPTYGLFDRKLRLYEIKHSLWNTELVLEEDEKLLALI